MKPFNHLHLSEISISAVIAWEELSVELSVKWVDISIVLKSAIFENGKYQHFFAGDFAQGSRVRKGDLAKYRSFH